MSAFPEKLKSARLRLGLTQEQLGYELNVTKASVSAWENGREAPSFRLLPKLRQLLGVSLDELICGLDGKGGTEKPADHTLRTMNEDEAALLKAFRRLSPQRRKGLLDMLG